VTLTLLLDLDDTLIGNKLDSFLPAYTIAFSGHLAPFVEPAQLFTALTKSTQYVFLNQRSDNTLMEVFNEDFYPSIGWREEQLVETLDEFYTSVFPTLQGVTQFRPGAVEMVQGAVQKGYRIGIATAPMMPRKAILHRLTWAGFPPGDLPFELISSMEAFHYTKPNPAFFAEFLGQMGWPEGPVVMVGDDQSADITSACQMGLSTFWVTPNQVRSPDKRHTSGKLEDVLPWLDSVSPEQLLPDLNSPSALLAILQSTPAVMDHFMREIPSEQWSSRLASDKWGLGEIVCHLRDVDSEVNIPRVEKILREINPFIPGIDSDQWAEERQYPSQDCRQAFQDFNLTRNILVSTFEKVESSDWWRQARHAILGPIRLQELVGIIASHDRLHIQQAHQFLQANSTPSY